MQVNERFITDELAKPVGEVLISGAKNAAIPLIAASLLSDSTSIIHNFPTRILDTVNKLEFLKRASVNILVNHELSRLEINARHFNINPESNMELDVRTTYLLAAGQLKRSHNAIIPYPGGCKIGERKIDLHYLLWEKMGVNIIRKKEYIYLQSNGLKGTEVDFPFPTIGGTENALLCASIADGKTIITNAYISPEVMDLIAFLRNMGTIIITRGNSYIEVIGGSELKGATYSVRPDRIETLTWLVYGVLSGGNIKISNVPFVDMKVPLIHLQNAGIDFFKNLNSILICPDCYPDGIQPFQLACGTHPGIISDMQPFFTLLALKANGHSMIVDYRYPERTRYLGELQKCLPIDTISSNNAGVIRVKGPAAFFGGELESTDLRGSMASIVFALCSPEKVIVNGIGKALRGYNGFFEKLKNLGVNYSIE